MRRNHPGFIAIQRDVSRVRVPEFAQPASPPISEKPLPIERGQELPLTRLCLELQDPPAGPHRDVDAFLQQHREQLGLLGEGPLLSQFLDQVWPEGIPATLIASNIGFDPKHPQWLLRPVSWGPKAQAFAAANQTLAMQVYRRQSRLAVKQFEITPHVPLRDHERVISAPLFWNSDNLWMIGTELDALGRLPFHRAKTRERLESWRQYLQWKELLIKKLQIKVPYLAWRWNNETCLEFLVKAADVGGRRLEHQELCVTQHEEEEKEDPTQEKKARPRKREREPLPLGEVESAPRVDPRDKSTQEKWQQQLPPEELRQVLIRLDEELAERLRQQESLLHASGLLVSAIAKDLGPLLNQTQAINRLQNSQGFCPRLADFLFEARSAGVPSHPPPPLEPLDGSRELNPGQVDAVQKALAAPDLCLIQGPPGTGKTTVIAELCLRMAHQGKRVLVASQTNLAVDNALSRLADKPGLRRLRLGDPERVDDDFRDFLADNVVASWFATIAEHSHERMEKTTRLEEELSRAQALLERLRSAKERHAQAQETLLPLRKRLQTLTGERASLEAQATDAQRRKEHAHGRADLFQSLARWAQGAAEQPILPEDFNLPELKPVSPRLLLLLAPEDPLRHMKGLPFLAALKGRAPAIEPFQKLLSEARRRCEGVTAVSAHPELAALLAERQRIATSVNPEDFAPLPEINRRIKKLQENEWSQFTLQLAQKAIPVLASAASAEIDELASALSPSQKLLPAIDVLARIAQGAVAASEQLSQMLPFLAQTFERQAGLEQSWEAQAARELLGAQEALAHQLQEQEHIITQQLAARQRAEAARREWNEAWSQLPPAQEPTQPSEPSDDALREASALHQQHHREGEAQLERRRRWRDLQKEWCLRLASVSESDRSQLQALYIQHANVVGMTCNEAGKRKIFQAPGFKPFDMVIIDEVSKATPTELIMPMLLGQKVVLVGDHRQLPPMFREREASFSEAKAEGEIAQEDFQKYQRMVTSSLFQELFEAAPESLKSMLWVQYRMHPQVMDAVNEFYGGKLEPGAPPMAADRREALGASRQHHLEIPDTAGGRFLEPRQHLLWVDSSWEARQRPHWEKQQGTSKLNELEVKLVLETLRRLNAALLTRGYGRIETYRAERAEEGQTLRALIQKRLGHPPESTLDDLFAEKRVRCGGRSQKPARPVRAGEEFRVDARRQVGVITFYGAQLRAIRKAIEQERQGFKALELKSNTVDRFQGMERPIVVVSLVRSMRGTMGEFVRQFQRINVGLSRAQELLIIIGAAETFKRASIELPPLTGGEPGHVEVYKNIFELAVHGGGRRHAWQLLG